MDRAELFPRFAPRYLAVSSLTYSTALRTPE